MEKLNLLFNELINDIHDEEEHDNLLNYLNNYIIQKNELKNKREYYEEVIKKFFDENNIYYCKSSKLYFNYLENNYIVCNEDNIIHYVLDFISCIINKSHYKNSIHIDNKKFIKTKILKEIKDKNGIYDNIPESETIQEIINFLVPTIFINKEYAKYFMISIGDIILKKYNNQKRLIFTKTCFRDFLNELSKHISIYIINTNLSNYFKYKYINEHENDECRLLPCNDVNFNFIKLNTQFFINLICVCIHYSKRYENADLYLEDEEIEEKTKKNIKLFHYQNKQNIVNKFKSKYLIPQKDQCILEKDILFLWKKYNNENQYFISLFSSYNDFCKELFISCNNDYDESHNKNILKNYYSLHIPDISVFIDFWNENFVYDDNEYYFELNEILYLFNTSDKRKKYNFNEKLINYVIQVNFSNFEIIHNKHIHNLKCKTWNKKKEIDDFIKKENINIKNESINNIYKKYCNTKNKLKINKKYFNMYLNKLKTS
jgi:hypothetical protein